MSSKRLAKRVLLVGWDAADWQHIDPLLEEGLLPTINELIEGGVMGNLATLQPVLSPMLWNSIATGKTADKHGIYGFTEPLPGKQGVQPSSSKTRKVKALWNILHQQEMKSNVVGWWASHPAEPINGTMVSNLFNGIKRGPKGLAVSPGTVHPREKQNEYAQLKIEPSELTEHDVLPFIPNAAEVDQDKDPRISTFAKILSDCASYQAVTTEILENDDWDLTAVYFDAIDHFCHAFMQYHPPRMINTKKEDFEIYKNVIRVAYQFHDMMLKRLMHQAGDDTIVVLCSDHGFQSGTMRPLITPNEPAGPAAWHRDHGVILVSGPGIKKDERIYGANIIDITPTILHMFGLPVGADMDGRVLTDIFESNDSPEFIPSWEEVDGECGMHTEETDCEDLSDDQAAELVKQFVALGYIDDPGEDKEKAAKKCQLELDYNLARVYQSTNRPGEALHLLISCIEGASWEDRYWKHLAICCQELGYHRQAIEIFRGLNPDTEKAPLFSQVGIARSAIRIGDIETAERCLNIAMSKQARLPNLQVTMGRLFIRLEDYDNAEKAFKKALEIDENHAPAYQGLSTLYRRQKRFEDAADAALDAVLLIHRLPQAHWNLGMAMIKLGDFDRAIQAFENLLGFNDNRFVLSAHRKLFGIYKNSLGDMDKAREHQLEARTILARRRDERAQRKTDIERMLDLPSIPDFEERRAAIQKERPRKKNQEAGERGSSGREFLIVSGLPRSGTSLMMQMLDAGGINAKTDGLREADEDNPQGYYEWEDIKQVNKKPELFDEEGLENLAIKAISMLLSSLPPQHKYKVIFMTRPTEQVAASQTKMIQRLGTEGANAEEQAVARQLETHRTSIMKWLEDQSNYDVLFVDYPELVKNPASHVKPIVEFIGSDRLPHADQLVNAIDPTLFRQRGENQTAEKT